MTKECDIYILRCIDEGKISVDYENGEIYSHHKNQNYKQMVNWAGYYYLDFKFFGERWSICVHRVIYLAKHRSIPDRCEIDHIDRDTSNNRISNLRAITHRENMLNRRTKNESQQD